MKNRALFAIRTVALAGVILSSILLYSYDKKFEAEQTAFDNIEMPTQQIPEVIAKDEYSTVTPPPAEPEILTTQDPKNAAQFAEFIEENSDFAAWLSIDGTNIDYPVMYSPEEPDFYLHHDFWKNESLSGTPYIGNGCDTQSDNIIIYAHNMKNGTMFADLLRYADESFFEEHPFIAFDTIEESSEYQIIAAFREKVHNQNEIDVFRYYNYTGYLSESDFTEYVEKIKAASIYDTGCTAVYGDRLITLSTCAYHTQNGRFVVVAVKKT